jgi:hypothetical protein
MEYSAAGGRVALGGSGIKPSAMMPWELSDEFPDQLERGLGIYYLTLLQIAGWEGRVPEYCFIRFDTMTSYISRSMIRGREK